MTYTINIVYNNHFTYDLCPIQSCTYNDNNGKPEYSLSSSECFAGTL